MPYLAALRIVVADLMRIDVQDRPKRQIVGGRCGQDRGRPVPAAAPTQNHYKVEHHDAAPARCSQSEQVAHIVAYPMQRLELGRAVLRDCCDRDCGLWSVCTTVVRNSPYSPTRQY